MVTFKNLLFTDIPHKYANIKLISCGNTIQVYIYEDYYRINEKGYERADKESIITIEDNIIKEENYVKDFKEDIKTIEEKNIIRSKNEMCRLVLANDNIWKSFITLTFEKNIFDVSIANKEFHKFITKIKKTFKDFSYIVVPEFQKNGRVHYHLLTNIDFYTSELINENFKLIKLYHNKSESQIEEIKDKFKEENLLKKYSKNDLNKLPIVFRCVNNELINCKCSYNKKNNDYKFFKTLRYWNNGFSNVIPIDNVNVSSYMSKYMTKDIDNRLFGKRRYSYSYNLKKPSVYYLDSKNLEDLSLLEDLLKNYEISFSNDYLDKFGNKIKFIEIKK